MPRLPLVRCAAFLMVLALAGCQTSQPESQANKTPPSAKKKNAASQKGGAEYSKLLEKASRDLARGEQASAAAAIEKLVQSESKLSEAQLVNLRRLQAELAPAEEPPKTTPEEPAKSDPQRPPTPQPPKPQDIKIADVRALIDKNQWPAALEEVEKFLQRTVDPEQRSEAGQLKQTIEAELHVRQELATALAELASDQPAKVNQGRDRLWRHSDRAAATLRSALGSNQPQLVAHAFEMLHPLQREDQRIKELVGILQNPKQQAVWPVALEQLGRTLDPAGAGEPLLKLALESKSDAQRQTALEALALVPDPPAETFEKLLPTLLEDGSDLVPALRAAANAALVHKQHDLVTGRGFESLSAKQRKQLAALPKRLKQLLGKSNDAPATPQAEAAWRVAVATGQQVAGPVPNVSVIAAANSRSYGPPSTLLDGDWEGLDLKKGMWVTYGERHPWVVLDLGEERTVTGVRIWNYNYSNARHRGWREVEIYISNTPSPMQPTLRGELPMAPGKKDMGDYGYTVPVRFARGRYVKLQARRLWSDEDQSGLSEVQILGFY